MSKIRLHWETWREALTNAAVVAVAWLVLIPLALWRIASAIYHGRNVLDEL